MTFPIFFVIKSMKYEVTGDTIVIKYIADGKYKQLELNKNDNIDLDFFGQLIKAKNNKQDAMCDLYAKEVLSYDPSPERITNMNLTKLDEPSEYTKKEDAKLRIEELKRDLKSTESDIQAMLLPSHKHVKIENLKDTYLKDQSKSNITNFNDLINKYNTIKQSIDKEQKIYDVNSKKENLTQDELIKTITNKIENKISNVIDDTDEQKQIMKDISNEMKPKEHIITELEQLNQIIDNFWYLLITKIEDTKTNYLEEKQKKLDIEIDIEDDLEISDDDDKSGDDDKKEIKDVDLLIEEEKKPIELTEEEEDEIINDILNRDREINNQKALIIEHIKIIKNILEKTDIKPDLINLLDDSLKILTTINSKNYEDVINILSQNAQKIEIENEENTIMYTKNTLNTIFKNFNQILLHREKITTLYNKKISQGFIDHFMSTLPENTENKLNNITFKNGLEIPSEVLEEIFSKAPCILIWKQKNDDNTIYSNINLFNKCQPTRIRFKTDDINCYSINTNVLQNYNYSIFKNNISTTKTDYKLPLQTMDLYLDLKPTTATKKINIGRVGFNFTYHGFNLNETNMSNIVNIVTGFGEGIKTKQNSGKIDLDKADTEEKLSEIVRLLQNISYNLFTLTPNYEESEKNKRLKSKGIDLKQLFD